MNTTITKTEKNLTEVKNYLKRCQNHIFFIEKTNTYFRVSLQEDKFTVHTFCNEVITTREFNLIREFNSIPYVNFTKYEAK